MCHIIIKVFFFLLFKLPRTKFMVKIWAFLTLCRANRKCLSTKILYNYGHISSSKDYIIQQELPGRPDLGVNNISYIKPDNLFAFYGSADHLTLMICYNGTIGISRNMDSMESPKCINVELLFVTISAFHSII